MLLQMRSWRMISGWRCVRSWQRRAGSLPTSCSGMRSRLSPTCSCAALGFDRDVHAQQVEAWSRELAEARRDYRDLTGKPPPTTPAEIRVLADRCRIAWLTKLA